MNTKGLWRVQAVVKLKNGVLDVQGRAVEAAIKQLGYEDVADLRVGKFIEFFTHEKPDESSLEKMGKELLANPVIETIEFSIEKAGGAS